MAAMLSCSTKFLLCTNVQSEAVPGTMYIKATRLEENIYKRLNGCEAKQTQHTLAGIPSPGIFVGCIFTIFTVERTGWSG